MLRMPPVQGKKAYYRPVYHISEKAFEQQGGKEAFDAERRRTINMLGLRRLLGSGE